MKARMFFVGALAIVAAMIPTAMAQAQDYNPATIHGTPSLASDPRPQKFPEIESVMILPPDRPAPQQDKWKLKATASPAEVVLNWTQATVPPPPAGQAVQCPNGATADPVTSNAIYRATTSGGEGNNPISVSTAPEVTFTDATVVAGTNLLLSGDCNELRGRKSEIRRTYRGGPSGIIASRAA